MKNFKIFIISFIVLFSLNSCGVIQDGFSLQKKDNTDEFLVQKKNPLKLPPNFDELPEPNSVNIIDNEQKNSEIKSLLTSSESNSDSSENNKDQTDYYIRLSRSFANEEEFSSVDYSNVELQRTSGDNSANSNREIVVEDGESFSYREL